MFFFSIIYYEYPLVFKCRAPLSLSQVRLKSAFLAKKLRKAFRKIVSLKKKYHM